MTPIHAQRRRPISAARGVLHFSGVVASTVVLLTLLAPTRLMPFRWRYPVITLWSRFNTWWLRVAAGVVCRVEGLENIPAHGPCIVVAKHQSSWETIVLETLFRPHCWVLKREFLRVPFAGWGAALLEPIPVDRTRGHQAVRTLVREGTRRLGQGRWVIIFPEGTRMPPGARRHYHVGAGALAAATGTSVLPVALNSGLFWPRHSPVRYAGTVTVRIGPAIDPHGRPPREIVRAAEEWIESQMVELNEREEQVKPK